MRVDPPEEDEFLLEDGTIPTSILSSIRSQDIETALLGDAFQTELNGRGLIARLYKTGRELSQDLAMQLVDADLQTDEARDIQVHAQAWTKMCELIVQAIHEGEEAADRVRHEDERARYATENDTAD